RCGSAAARYRRRWCRYSRQAGFRSPTGEGLSLRAGRNSMSCVRVASRAALLAAAASLAMAATAADAGHKFQVLYAFKDKADGGRPHDSLILDREGNLYGTTLEGGTANCWCS